MNLKNSIFGAGSSGPSKHHRSFIRVTDAMTTGIVTLAPNDSFDRAIELIVSGDYQHLVVIDDKQKVLGLVSKADIVGNRWRISEWRHKQVHQAMTANPITVTMDTPLSDAISTMIAKHLDCLPVIKYSGVLCGVLSFRGLMKFLHRMLEAAEA